MFHFKKRSGKGSKHDDVVETPDVSNRTPYDYSNAEEDDQHVYSIPQDVQNPNLSHKLQDMRKSSGSFLRRKKSLKEKEEKARSRAMNMSIDYESNVTPEYLALNIENKVERPKLRASSHREKGSSSRSVGSSVRSSLRRKASKSKNSQVHYATDVSDSESVFSNPFEDDSDCETLGSYQSAASVKTMPNMSGRSRYDDDSSIGSYGSAASGASYYSSNSYAYQSAPSFGNNSSNGTFQYASSSSSLVNNSKLRAYTPRLSADQVPSTTEAMLLHQARQVTEQRQPRPKLHQVSDYSSPDSMSSMQSYGNGSSKKKGGMFSSKRDKGSHKTDPMSPSSAASTPSSSSGGGKLRSRLFGRKSKTTDLMPPALM